MAASSLQRLEELDEVFHTIDLLQYRYLRDHQNPMEIYSDEEFRMRYRLKKDAVFFVLNLIEGELISKHGPAISVLHQLLICLRYYATGSFQQTIGDLHQVTQQSCSNIVKRVSEALNSCRPRFIRYPSHTAANDVRRRFYDIGQFPGVVGCLDCTHVMLKCELPRLQKELYRNRKGWFSINVQAICGPDLELYSLVAYWYGSAHDSRIFDNSTVRAKLENGEYPGILLGDGGYPNLPFLHTPLRNPVTPAERRYNVAHIKTRNTIERFNGVWKRIFPILSVGLRVNLDTSKMIIRACGVLYNIRKLLNDGGAEDFPDVDNVSVPVATGHPQHNAGNAARNALIIQHFGS